MTTYVIINRRDEFFAGLSYSHPLWVKEYPEAQVFDTEQEAREVWKQLTPLMTKIVVDYGLATERTL